MTWPAGTLFKVTTPNGEPIHGGSGRWPLPKRDRLGRLHPAAWRTVEGSLVKCYNGLHVVDEEHVLGWVHINEPFAVWIVDVRGERIDDSDKVVVRSARLRRPVVIADQDWIDAYRGWSRAPSGVEGIKVAEPVPKMNGWRPARPLVGLDKLVAFDREYRTRQAPPQPFRLTFGVHVMDTFPVCPAWPTDARVQASRWRRTKARMNRILGPLSPDEVARLNGLTA